MNMFISINVDLKQSIIFIGFIFIHVLELVHALTGHVCSRQKAETYQTTYDRAFICPERYTTACGQLDWRRCSKYRVNTCYTPTQKYAVRYYTVDECCPGWKDAGDGACTIPVCADGCANGGSCGVTSGGVPGCICPENYSGSRCQYGRHFMQTIILVSLLCFGACALVAVGLHLYCRNLHKRTLTQELMYLKRLDLRDTETLLAGTEAEQDEQTRSSEHREIPSAPIREQ